jgi:hypothetical protein
MLASFLIFFSKNVIQKGGQFLKKNVDKNRKNVDRNRISRRLLPRSGLVQQIRMTKIK